jgi:hypothetical protein
MSNKERLNRRDFLRLTALGVGSLALGSCEELRNIKGVPTATPEPTKTPTNPVELLATSTPIQPAKTPEPENTTIAENTIAREWFKLAGIPERIHPGHQVLIAENDFTNTIGLGTESWLAEPGVALVGPDFDSKIAQESNGHTEYINPTNQQVFEGPEAYFNIPEGGFMIASGASMEIALPGNRAITLEGQERHNWLVIIRGLFADSKQDSDRNSTAHFINYVPGHTLAMRYPQGAFVSEGQFQQIVSRVHENGTNCGAEGCSKVSAIFLDLNTDACTIISQEQEKEWQPLFSNWQK